MLDHLGFNVGDYAASREFYRQALAPLGFGIVMEVSRETTGGYEGCGFGPPGRPQFWVGNGGGDTHSNGSHAGGMHIAFVAKSRAEVHAFHAAAIAAGGRDNGAPGLRPQYHPDYYGAFVIDINGHNIEAVCHAPETT